MKVDAYIRVSQVRGREGDSFISPTMQKDRIEAWAKAGGHTIAELHEDLDQPGSKIGRPGLTRAMERVESGKTGGIVCAYLSRFGRSVYDSARLLERLREAGGALFTVQEGIDTRGPTGKLVADILSAIAEWELVRIRDNWAEARAMAVSRGVHISGHVPTGYRQGEGKRLEPSESAAVVRELFERRAARESWGSLADWLSASAVSTPHGNENWSVNSVKAVVRNRVYLGEARANKGVTNPSAHEPLVSRAVWETANRAAGVSQSRNGRVSGLLSGLIRCAGCRYAMKPSRHSSGHLEYRCKAGRRETAGRCDAPATVMGEKVEALMLERFFDFVGGYRAKGFASEDDLGEAEGAVWAAENELAAFLDGRIADVLGSDSEVFLAALRERQETVEAARQVLADRQAKVAPLDLGTVDVKTLWPDLTLYERRQLLASVFDCVFVRRGSDLNERTFICWHGEAPELPVRGQRWVARPFDFPDDSPEALTQ